MQKELPEDIFEVLPPDQESSQTPSQSPSMRDLVWMGKPVYEDFRVKCKFGAQPGIVSCGACIIEGSTVKRLSFVLEVGSGGSLVGGGFRPVMRDFRLETHVEEVKEDVATISRVELIFGKKLGEGVQVGELLWLR